MGDASANVAPQLLYHFSAVSQFKYAPQGMLPTQMVLDLLLKAPAVAQQYPFVWTMLDAPQEGSVLLVWISPSTTPATDGCVWLEQEHFFSAEEKGYVSIDFFGLDEGGDHGWRRWNSAWNERHHDWGRRKEGCVKSAGRDDGGYAPMSAGIREEGPFSALAVFVVVVRCGQAVG